VDFMRPLMRTLYSDGYLFLISRLVPVWTLLYKLSDTPALSLINVHLRRFVDRVAGGRFIRYLLAEKPKVVIATQFLASELVTIAKIKRGLKTRLVTVVTDFGVHNFWVNPATDLYCVAAESTRRSLIGKGVPQEVVRVTGIPFDDKFRQPFERNEALRSWGFDPSRFTALVATGGVGIGPIEEVVRQLKEEVQLLVVCGTNKKLYAKLKQENHPNIRVFEFVDFMHRLMSAADVIVTKAGGLTVTESLVKNLCCIFFYIIPGQEKLNARTITRHGAGFFEHSARRVAWRVRHLKANPDLLRTCQQEARKLARPAACQDILDTALSAL
ncbi:MAG: MGDG synthase family glycosyltransferase, partial [Deltaproteobacteria bacterium]